MKTSATHQGPKCAVGDRLWVRETFAEIGPGFIYAATDRDHNLGQKWRPSIFMPRKASRLALEVLGVRVEKLSSLSPTDAIAEGLTVGAGVDEPLYGWDGAPRWYSDPRDAYRAGWDSINGAGSAAADPLVWVITFRIERDGSRTLRRERPLLFSAPMVRALLAGRKTQTRRIVKS